MDAPCSVMERVLCCCRRSFMFTVCIYCVDWIFLCVLDIGEHCERIGEPTGKGGGREISGTDGC